MNEQPQLNSKGNRRGMSPESRKNLVINGNNHAKKDYSITRIVKEMLDNPAEERWLEPEDKHNGLTWREAIAKRILIEATRGNAKVTSELLDRLEGKVPTPIDVGNKDDKPFLVGRVEIGSSGEGKSFKETHD